MQFLEENATPVVGLREGSFIRQRGSRAELKGPHSARLFQRGRAPREVAPGADLLAESRS